MTDIFFWILTEEAKNVASSFKDACTSIFSDVYGSARTASSNMISLIQTTAVMSAIDEGSSMFADIRTTSDLTKTLSRFLLEMQEEFRNGDTAAKILLGSMGFSVIPLQKIALFYGNTPAFHFFLAVEQEELDTGDDLMCEEFSVCEWAFLCYHFRAVNMGSRSTQMVEVEMKENALKNIHSLMTLRPAMFRKTNSANNTSFLYLCCLFKQYDLIEQLFDRELVSYNTLNVRERSYQCPFVDNRAKEFTAIECLIVGMNAADRKGRASVMRYINHRLFCVPYHRILTLIPPTFVDEIVAMISKQDFLETSCWDPVDGPWSGNFKLAQIIMLWKSKETVERILEKFREKKFQFLKRSDAKYFYQSLPPKEWDTVTYGQELLGPKILRTDSEQDVFLEKNPHQWLSPLLLKFPDLYVRYLKVFFLLDPLDGCQMTQRYTPLEILCLVALVKDSEMLEKAFDCKSELFTRCKKDDSSQVWVNSFRPELEAILSNYTVTKSRLEKLERAPLLCVILSFFDECPIQEIREKKPNICMDMTYLTGAIKSITLSIYRPTHVDIPAEKKAAPPLPIIIIQPNKNNKQPQGHPPQQQQQQQTPALKARHVDQKQQQVATSSSLKRKAEKPLEKSKPPPPVPAPSKEKVFPAFPQIGKRQTPPKSTPSLLSLFS